MGSDKIIDLYERQSKIIIYYLMKNGYSTYNAFKGNIDDGVHYSTRTYKRIYKYCLKSI